MRPPTARTKRSSSLLAVPRALVSQNKRRYQQRGYDLDLCYLHPRVIVMGFPATGLEATYRNSRRDVQHFLTESHSNNFKVYNFCAEKGRHYGPHEFADRVAYFPIEDHHVPTFHQILLFCEDAAAWLNADASRVVVMHCKAGKGRAGMMACMLLLKMQYAASAQAAIEWYNRERVHDRRGLTVTSQKKWVHYCEQLLQLSTPEPVEYVALAPGFTIEQLALVNTPTLAVLPQLRLRIFVLDTVTAKRQLVYETTSHEKFLVHTHVHGCVLFEFRSIHYTKCLTRKHFRLWFHTLFTTPDSSGVVCFDRNAMDWVERDRKLRKFPAAFQLEMRVR